MMRGTLTILPVAVLATCAASACSEDATKDRAAIQPASAIAAPASPASPAPPALTALGLEQQRNPIEGVLTGGQPTDEQLQRAKAMGVKTVINLRSAGESADYAAQQAGAAALGMTYIHIPIDSETGDGLDEDNARKLGALLDRAARPMIVHCATGQRVGALFALKAFHVDGETAAEALQLGKDAGLSKPALLAIVTARMTGPGARPAKTK